MEWGKIFEQYCAVSKVDGIDEKYEWIDWKLNLMMQVTEISQNDAAVQLPNEA